MVTSSIIVQVGIIVLKLFLDLDILFVCVEDICVTKAPFHVFFSDVVSDDILRMLMLFIHISWKDDDENQNV